MQGFKRLISFIVVVAVAIGCVGCQKKQDKVKLLLDWWPNPNHVPLYVGLKQGIFKKHGVDLSILSLQDPPDSITYLKTEQADLAVYYMPQTLRAHALDKSIRVAGVLIDEPLQGFLVRKDSGIENVGDFEGRSLGVFPEGMTIAYVDTMQKLKNFAFKEIKHVQFDVAAALYTKSIDVISGIFWNIEPHQLSANGVETRAFKLKDVGFPNYPELVVITGGTFADKNPKKLDGFRKALDESIAYVKSHQDEALSIYFSMHPDKSHLTKEWEAEAWKTTAPLLAKSQDLDIEGLQKFHDWMWEKDLLKRRVNLETVKAWKSD